jgi:hypothetical protein
MITILKMIKQYHCEGNKMGNDSKDLTGANKKVFEQMAREVITDILHSAGPFGVALEKVLFFSKNQQETLEEIDRQNLVHSIVNQVNANETAIQFFERQFSNPYMGSLLYRVQKLLVEKAGGSINDYYEYMAGMFVYVSSVDSDQAFVEAEMLLNLLDRLSVGSVYLLMQNKKWPKFNQEARFAINGRVSDYQDDFSDEYIKHFPDVPRYLVQLAVAELASNRLIEGRNTGGPSYVVLTDLGQALVNALEARVKI